MKVRNLMTYPIAAVRPNATVVEAIEVMVNGRKGCVLVASEGLLKKCVGLLTTGQIFRKVLAVGIDPARVNVEKIMITVPLITISPNASAKEAAELMIKHNVRRLPVVENGVLVGIITSMDLLKCID